MYIYEVRMYLPPGPEPCGTRCLRPPHLRTLLPRALRTLAGAELLYASLFCNGDVDVARTALTFKASSSLRGNRRFDFGYRLGAACVLLVRTPPPPSLSSVMRRYSCAPLVRQ